MKVIVKTNEIEIEKNNLINSGEYNITPCEFEFSEEYNGLTKMAVFSTCSIDVKVAILNNRCVIPYEILENQGQVLLGVYGYESVNDELELRYSPTPKYFYVIQGSYKEGNDPELPPKSEWEQVIEEVNTAINEANNLNIEAEKVGKVTTITITHKDGEEQEVQILDGEKGDKGDKGDAGSIKMIIVQALPTENIDESAIYLLPLENPTEEGNNYAEYIYVNNQWELLGRIGVQVDLTDYVKNTDYGNATTGGVVKGTGAYSFTIDNQGRPNANTLTYEQYGSYSDNNFISKGTLNNVITGKGLVSNTDYANSSVGGVIKTGKCLGLNNGVVYATTLSYSNYTSAGNDNFISKGTLENVLTAKIGDIQTLLDNLNNGGGVQ